MNVLSDEFHKITRTFQRTINTRRRHFKTIVVNVLNRHCVVELVADFFAVVQSNPAVFIDRDADQTAREFFHIDELVTQAFDGGIDHFK